MSTPPTLTQMPPEVTRQEIRTPRAAAVAGIVFGVLLITALVLVRVAVPAKPNDAGAWLSESSRRNSVLFALSLVPFAGIAFLWFIGVVRNRIGEAEDRFFATVFLGSGLLFVGMLFVAAAAAAGIVAAAGQNRGGAVATEVWTFGRRVTYTVLTIYAMRMAAVFTISMSTLLLRSGTAPRWLGLSGYAIAVVLLLTVGFFAWVELLFPAWVLLLSSYILVESIRTDRSTADLPSSVSRS
jgi:hypothetical protein